MINSFFSITTPKLFELEICVTTQSADNFERIKTGGGGIGGGGGGGVVVAAAVVEKEESHEFNLPPFPPCFPTIKLRVLEV